jgi:hypothetical protein
VTEQQITASAAVVDVPDGATVAGVDLVVGSVEAFDRICERVADRPWFSREARYSPATGEALPPQATWRESEDTSSPIFYLRVDPDSRALRGS